MYSRRRVGLCQAYRKLLDGDISALRSRLTWAQINIGFCLHDYADCSRRSPRGHYKTFNTNRKKIYTTANIQVRMIFLEKTLLLILVGDVTYITRPVVCFKLLGPSAFQSKSAPPTKKKTQAGPKIQHPLHVRNS